MLDIDFALSQALRFQGLDFFPTSEEAVMELALAIQTADTRQYAIDVVDDWLNREQVTASPKPGQIRAAIYDRNQVRIRAAAEAKRRQEWNNAERESREPTLRERDARELKTLFTDRLATVDARYLEQPARERDRIKSNLAGMLDLIDAGASTGLKRKLLPEATEEDREASRQLLGNIADVRLR